jgi:hypothetical protein
MHPDQKGTHQRKLSSLLGIGMVIQLNSMLGIGMLTLLLLFPGVLKQEQSEAAEEPTPAKNIRRSLKI